MKSEGCPEYKRWIVNASKVGDWVGGGIREEWKGAGLQK